MKGAIFSILPFVGLAFAQESACPAEPDETITETEVETVYKTATPTPALVADATTSPGSCGPSIVSVTMTEKVYVTVTYTSGTYVTPDAVKTIDVTSTSTLDIYTTVTLHPSGSVHPSGGYFSNSTTRGSATWYGGNLSGGTCSFVGYTIPAGIYGTAISDFNWDTAGACGTCVSVTGPKGNTVKAMVVDQCPGCGPNHLDLFPDGFAALASPNAGNITVDWAVVPCGISSPIVLKNKSGTSKFWFSMQVMNANVGVAKLEVSTDGGASWKQTKRQPYNFFENPAGFGTDAVDVRVTSTDGKSIVVKNVGIKSESKTTAGGNFA
ncbi:Endoglucanase C-terminal domain subunit [Pyrenophora tritici-repentis]|nr:Carbohydrate-binding module family 63 protein [Pyrenophora tritici-repentis]KAI0626623.1 Carbohydrate-binding module family 63 protein [Pyrenophora tritici-repentis]KAI1528375.1 Endoglucanase C-terminal domain subunit [Pyrenophora tritici-repentis]KAI1538642.1 Endoglucanase C-terminal domain subunit [Pyrenophora tritici-repentis]KAI1573794.1 Endoglucanase C-terminal domain subunit [Pyrenophora tritici-repentis]